MRRSLVCVFMSLLLPLCSYAGDIEGIATGKVKGYVINTGAVYVQIDDANPIKAGCNSSNRFVFKFDQAYSDAFLSSILSAYASGSELILTGTSNCDITTNSETLRKICTLNMPC